MFIDGLHSQRSGVSLGPDVLPCCLARRGHTLHPRLDLASIATRPAISTRLTNLAGGKKPPQG
jgi:hypothetical protein